MSWEQMLAIVQAAKTDLAHNRAGPPSACPNDGEPLQTGPDGRLFCVADGWTWAGGPVTW